MPKMKSNRAAAKRLRATGTGKVRHARSGIRHLMRGKPAKRLRDLRKNGILDAADEARVKRLLPYSF
jgi:large subunit ribosomal protein L35